MSVDPRVRPWLLEALAAAGGAATSLEVARHVWTHHEADLRASDDLLLTWQVDLQQVATALREEGALAEEASGWRLVDGAPRRRSGAWDEDEIAVVVTAYVSLLQAEQEGRPTARRQVLSDVAARTGRTPEAVEMLLSQISGVVQERGIEPLSGIRPRSNVPVGVRPAVAAALEA